VLLLQHPSEVNHALNTARLAALGLVNAQLVVGEVFEDLQALLNPEQAASSLNSKILAKLRENNGSLPVSDKSDPTVISNLFGVSKGNFKKAIGALYKQGQIVIHADRIELS